MEASPSALLLICWWLLYKLWWTGLVHMTAMVFIAFSLLENNRITGFICKIVYWELLLNATSGSAFTCFSKDINTAIHTPFVLGWLTWTEFPVPPAGTLDPKLVPLLSHDCIRPDSGLICAPDPYWCNSLPPHPFYTLQEWVAGLQLRHTAPLSPDATWLSTGLYQ